MFLFDKQRTGRCSKEIDVKKKPRLRWRINLPTIKNTAPESTPIEDDAGNLYFGAHNGMIYSAHPRKGVKWSWYTGPKVYSSPLWIDKNSFSICTGSGLVLAFSRSGKLLWSYDMTYTQKTQNKRIRLALHIIHLPLTYDWKIRKIQNLKCWASPNFFNKTLYTVAYGKGLHAINCENGSLKWSFDLGFPFYHRAGVAISNSGCIYIASNRAVFCLSEEGKIIWKSFGKGLFYEVWSNPSLDEDNKQVYVTWSKGENFAVVKSLDVLNGKVIWIQKIPSGVRGSISIGLGPYLYLPALNGNLYALDKLSGEIVCCSKIGANSRGLWTSPALLHNDFILITTKQTSKNGTLTCLEGSLKKVWSIQTPKALSVPIINRDGEIVFGAWDSCLYGYS